jgi:nitroimidazol reductase NimA-like FMN-containing flavoprotein (pyridoxamine 5'-phosphate oxidase superfamily)
MKEIPAKVKESADSAELLRLAYLGGKGFPHAIPVWFVEIDDYYYIATDAGHAKSRALREDGRAGWVIDGGTNPKYWGVSYAGRGEEVSDSLLRARIYRAMGEKYFTSADDPNIERIFGKVDDPNTVYFRLKPESVSSWEY